jgi:hypothetical protein
MWPVKPCIACAVLPFIIAIANTAFIKLKLAGAVPTPATITSTIAKCLPNWAAQIFYLSICINQAAILFWTACIAPALLLLRFYAVTP